MEVLINCLIMSEKDFQENIDLAIDTYDYIRRDAKEYLLSQSHLIKALFLSSVAMISFTGRDCAYNHCSDEKRLIAYLLLYKFKPDILKKFYDDDIFNKIISPKIDMVIDAISENKSEEDHKKDFTILLYTLDLYTNFMRYSNTVDMFIREEEADDILNDFISKIDSEQHSSLYLETKLSEYSKVLHHLIEQNKIAPRIYNKVDNTKETKDYEDNKKSKYSDIFNKVKKTVDDSGVYENTKYGAKVVGKAVNENIGTVKSGLDLINEHLEEEKERKRLKKERKAKEREERGEKPKKHHKKSKKSDGIDYAKMFNTFQKGVNIVDKHVKKNKAKNVEEENDEDETFI